MKAFLLLTAIFATAFSSFADFTNSPENFSPHFSTNTQIIWSTSTDHLPKSLWTYKKILPHIFSALTISNAIVMASLTNKGFPKPSTNDFHVSEEMPPNWPGMIPDIFSIAPSSATIFYWLPHPDTNAVDIPSDDVLIQRAYICAARLGVDPAQVAFKVWTYSFKKDEDDNDLTNQIIGRGVYLSRQLDGIKFMSIGNDGFIIEGFYIEFGNRGQIRTFTLVWPEFIRDKKSRTASPQQIIACIRARKIIVIPNAGEETYFQRVKALANVKTFTITKITPYYSEGVFGEAPTNDEPPKIIMPIAELEAVADFGNSNATVRLISPILSSEISRLLAKPATKQ